jgi:hypothetical protein
MTTPVTINIAVWRNVGMPPETWRLVDVVDGEDVPIDLTGWDMDLQVRLYGLAGGAPLLNLSKVTSLDEGLFPIEPTDGQVVIFIFPPTLESLPVSGRAGEAARFRYDLVLTDPSGIEAVYAQGDFIVYPGVTR